MIEIIGNPLVSVCMVTFNHEKYIREAIESILAQKAYFRIELVIGEDCSLDKTKKICIEYAEKFSTTIRLLPSERNLGPIQNYIRTIQACIGRYIAFCEGDDYWTDPLKLQKQIDYLESDTNYGLIHSGYLNCNNQGEKNNPFLLGQKDLQGDVFEKLLIQNRIGTLTVVVRRSLLIDAVNYYQLNKDNMQLYDIFLWLYCSLNSRIAFLDDVTAAYRIIKGSASNPVDPVNKARFLVDISKIELFYAKTHSVLENVKKTVRVKADKRSLYLNFLIKNRRDFFNNLFNLLKLRSVSKKDLIYTIGLFVPFVHRLIIKRINSIY